MYDGNYEGAEKLLRESMEILPQTSDMEDVIKYVHSNYALVQERLGKTGEKVVHGQIK